jgi:hypothetical protein
MVAIDREALFYAKNSDRDPGEPQIIQYCTGSEGLEEPSHPEHRREYDRIQYRSLRKAAEDFSCELRALVSRPSWIWGAEMGVNEKGVTIGNEAVFSLRRTRSDGLLGMDILRLTLHNAHSAEEAVGIIASLIESHGQGGNGSYTGTLHYHNSFLAADRREAWGVETAGSRWAARKVDSFTSISNDYTIGNDYSRADRFTLEHRRHFSRRYASPVHRWFTKSGRRRLTTMAMLEGNTPSWDTMRDILIRTEGDAGDLDHSMRSICMDATGFVTSRTAASMIVEHRPDRSLVWLSGAPLPVYSPLFPHTLSDFAFRESPYTAPAYGFMVAGNRLALTELILTAPPDAKSEIASIARETERSCMEKVRKPFLSGTEKELDTACAECADLEPVYRALVEKVLKDYGVETKKLFEKPDCYYHCG